MPIRSLINVISVNGLSGWLKTAPPEISTEWGPDYRLTMGHMLEEIGTIASNPYELTWVSEAFLQAQEVAPWSDLPAWIPGDPLMFVAYQTSLDAGLTFRPLSETARDTVEWDKTRPAEERENRRFGMSREREREVLDAWHTEQG